MRIVRDAAVGTLESSDTSVRISPAETLDVHVHTSVEAQYGTAVREVVNQTLRDLGILAARVTVEDKGALDCTLRARIQAAAFRAAEEAPDWAAITGALR